MAQSSMIQKMRLHSTFSSLDEIELTGFLKDKDILTSLEKKYLVKYVLKGIPDHLRGKVITDI